MTFSDLFAKLKISERDAEVIFDRDEPVGAATDLVMPRKKWFGRSRGKEGRFAIAPAVENRRSSMAANTDRKISS